MCGDSKVAKERTPTEPGVVSQVAKKDTALKKSRKKVCTTTMEVVLLTLKAAEKKRAADA